MKTMLGVIGGSGVYDLPGLENQRWEKIRSPFGQPSGALRRGVLGGVEMAFLPRHGRGHSLGPAHINYRANIDALKRAGATDLLSVSACGSLREELAPGAFVVVDQFIDRTKSRPASFFGPGLAAHVSMAEPVSARLADLAEAALRAEQIPWTRGGTYLAIEGPQFSTRAESRLYRSWNCDVIGMTAMPEARLAREAELPYAAIAMVTDYDCWRETGEAVEVADVLGILRANAEKAGRVVARIAAALGDRRAPDPQGLDEILDVSVVTRPEARDPDLLKKLDAILARFLQAEAQKA